VKLIKTILQNGLELWYRSDDKYIGERIALQKYEEYESLLMLRNVNKDSVVVDVGANIGYYTLLLAKVCKKVYAFEPDKICFEILLKNIKENKLTNVVAKNLAVSDQIGKVKFIVDKDNFGNSRLGDGDKTILCDSLDNILKNEKQIDLIKIDVQGHEPQVIAGAEKIIIKYSPILFLEFNGNNKMISFLKKYYKNIFTIDYWFYILRRGIKIDRKLGYIDLMLINKNINLWERYKNLQGGKVIKKILGKS
jgi:FkbM family methyltransferase